MGIRRILLVDDDRALTQVLRLALEEEGLEVRVAHDGKEGWREFQAHPPELLILDVLMPEMDGLEVCRRVRSTSSVPIILLTSRSEEIDRITGLDLGADDYVTKPFSTRELCARIRALGRRVGTTEGPPRTEAELLQVGALHIDVSRFEVRWQQSLVPLTRSEFLMLAALARHKGIVLTRDRLLDLVRGEDVVVTDRTVDTYVKRIRKKLREVDPTFDGIETLIGMGYRYKDEP